MPRDGSGVYSKPAGTTAVANTVIESAKYNSTIDDLVADANTARPIVAGGSGATTAVAAGDAYSTKGADIASAATTDIGAATGRYVHITGTTTITSFGTKTAGVLRVLTFDGALTITHNATSLILPNAASILTGAGDVAVFVSEGGGNWRCVSYSRASGAAARATPGHLYGLALSNNSTDATNDIDIAAGEAASDAASPVLITLASALTKRLDAAWAVGTGNGGLDTGSIANTTYHIWLIQRSDTGVVDALFSTSATAPTMPTNYDRKRRIGSIVRASAAIRLFDQNNDNFLYRVVPTADRSSTSGAVAALLTVSVPAGIVVNPILKLTLNIGGASSNVANALGSATAGGTPAFIQQVVAATAYLDMAVIPPIYATNTSSQLYFGCQINSGTIASNTVETLGWVDTRGK